MRTGSKPINILHDRHTWTSVSQSFKRITQLRYYNQAANSGLYPRVYGIWKVVNQGRLCLIVVILQFSVLRKYIPSHIAGILVPCYKILKVKVLQIKKTKRLRSILHEAVGNTIFTHRGHQNQQKVTMSNLSIQGTRKVPKSNTQMLPQAFYSLGLVGAAGKLRLHCLLKSRWMETACRSDWAICVQTGNILKHYPIMDLVEDGGD